MKIMITGGSGGLGKLLTPLLEEEEHEVLSLSSRDLDISDSVWVAYKILEEEPEVLINMATMSVDSLLSKVDVEDSARQLAVNTNGGLNLIRSFAATCKELEIPGRYIYISSILSDRPVPGAGVYSACKAFNDSLVKTAALENARYGITFNSIQLGFFGAGLCERLHKKVKETAYESIPLKRWGRIEELKNLIDYFIKTEYATGTVVKLTGGFGV